MKETVRTAVVALAHRGVGHDLLVKLVGLRQTPDALPDLGACQIRGFAEGFLLVDRTLALAVDAEIPGSDQFRLVADPLLVNRAFGNRPLFQDRGTILQPFIDALPEQVAD